MGAGETLTVDLEREIVAALVRTLRPDSPDLGTTDKDIGGWERCRWTGLASDGMPVLFLRYGLFLFAWRAGPLVQDLLGQPRLLPRMLFGATHAASPWLIWPEDGCASIA